MDMRQRHQARWAAWHAAARMAGRIAVLLVGLGLLAGWRSPS
jgi:hypothetical protein